MGSSNEHFFATTSSNGPYVVASEKNNVHKTNVLAHMGSATKTKLQMLNDVHGFQDCQEFHGFHDVHDPHVLL